MLFSLPFGRFVDRYIPGYVFFGDGPTGGFTDNSVKQTWCRWLGNSLRIVISETREVIEVQAF